jgi:adenylate cyclase
MAEKPFIMDKISDHFWLLDKVLNSQTFANKEVQKNLLSFLYTSASQGKSLREIDIALDFFKRSNTFQPGEDTIVRVNVYKLRALLEKYYQNEGVKDELVFDLPKGSY